MSEKSILLIEPSEGERKELTAILERMGYGVDGAQGSADGLHLFSEGRHDLVVVEVLLSGINGLKVCKIIKEQGVEWGVKVVVISKIYQSRAMEFDALKRYQADAYFAQPFPIVKLLESIGRLIGEPEHKARQKAEAAIIAASEKMEAKSDSTMEAEPSVERAVAPPPEPKAAPAPEPAPAPAPESASPPEPELKSRPRPETPPKTKSKTKIHFFEPEQMEDEGRFTPEQLGPLLARLVRERVDGTLTLKRDSETKQIYLVEGRPVFAQSTNQEESLGRMLLADGILTEKQYREAMVQMGETSKKLGTVLTRLGYLTNEELYYQLVRQTQRKVAHCFSWSEGEFAINRVNRYPTNAPTFEVESAAIVLDGYRRYFQAERLEASYDRDKDRYLFLGEPDIVVAVRVHLSEEEARLLNAADGTERLSEIVGASGLGLIDTLRLLQALIGIGAVRLAQIEKSPDLSAYETKPPPVTEYLEPPPEEQARYREFKELAVRLDDMNLFEVLGLEKNAEQEEINRAYLDLQKKFAPDRLSPTAPRRIRRMAAAIMERLQEAYDTLSDSRSRHSYLNRMDGEGQAPAGAAAGKTQAEADEEKKQPSATAQYQKGLLAFERRKYSAAVEALQKVVSAEPMNVEYRLKLAEAMYQMLAQPAITWSDIEEAAKQVLALDKKNAEALALIGRVKARQGDDETALRYLKKAYELNPRNELLKREIHYTEQRQKEEMTVKKKSIFGKIL